MNDSFAAEVSGFDEEDLEAIRDSMASVLSEQCDSIAVHAYVDGKSDLVESLESQARDLGWVAIGLPEEKGGIGLGAYGVKLLHEQLGAFVAPGGFLATGVAAQVLAEHGSDCELAQSWLSQLVAGDVQAAIPAVVDDKISRDAGGGISGTITLLGATDAAIAVVAVGPDELALVDLSDLSLEALDFWDRTRTLSTVKLDGVEPVAWLGQGAAARRAFARTYAIAVAADCIGLARSIAEKTVEYMKERVQFGRPIGSFQALKHRAVDLVARIGIAEHTIDQAVEVASEGDAVADMWAKLAKAAASEAAVFVAGDCVQLYGGVGFTWEYDVHLYLKRARLSEMLVADNAHLRDMAAADLASTTRSGKSTLELSAL